MPTDKPAEHDPRVEAAIRAIKFRWPQLGDFAPTEIAKAALEAADRAAKVEQLGLARKRSAAPPHQKEGSET